MLHDVPTAPPRYFRGWPHLGLSTFQLRLTHETKGEPELGGAGAHGACDSEPLWVRVVLIEVGHDVSPVRRTITRSAAGRKPRPLQRAVRRRPPGEKADCREGNSDDRKCPSHDEDYAANLCVPLNVWLDGADRIIRRAVTHPVGMHNQRPYAEHDQHVSTNKTDDRDRRHNRPVPRDALQHKPWSPCPSNDTAVQRRGEAPSAATAVWVATLAGARTSMTLVVRGVRLLQRFVGQRPCSSPRGARYVMLWHERAEVLTGRAREHAQDAHRRTALTAVDRGDAARLAALVPEAAHVVLGIA